MKNSTKKIALLGAGLFSAASVHAAAIPDALAPNVDFYGSIRLGVDYIDAGVEDDGANGRDFLSRVGVKASTEIQPGLQVVGVVEYGIREENIVDFVQNKGPTLRLAFVGMKGDWGELYYGSQTNVFHKYLRTSYFSDGLDSIRQGAVRDDDLLQYYYNKGKFSFGASVMMEGQDGDSFDQFQLGGQYTEGPFKLQLGWSKDNRGENKGNLYGIRGWWNVTDNITVSAFHHYADDQYDIYGGSLTGTVRLRDAEFEGNKNALNACRTENRTSSAIFASYRTGPHQIQGKYAVDACEVSGDVDSVKLEYAHHFSKRFRLWTAIETFDNDEGRKPTTASGESFTQVQAGARFDF
ncbi:porin [Alteromonas sp. 1_MG-2023]|uniref:porin n=1 Tax=Alteromonas sp. 1_MG-2023 TaxID=3062669 RepID=UPI0026E3F8D9|nr:porin [Alteromonas sp. 1_MG-2023]MDO6474096.1 porin [Alteromonas sp. 1_MG-2023]